MKTIYPLMHSSQGYTSSVYDLPHLNALENKSESRCSTCRLGHLCLIGDKANKESSLYMDKLVRFRRQIKRGETVYTANAAFNSLYAIRRGSFKTTLFTPEGNEQVLGFSMTGEVLGFDGIGSERHTLTATAIEDSEVCVIPFKHLEEWSEKAPGLLHQLHKIMSREIIRDQSVMLLLGSMRAEERVATFLLNLSQRFVARGFAACEFHLRMTREEIGSYLGLKLETVSRIFSKLQKLKLIEVQQKHIRILDIEKLKQSESFYN